MNQKKNNQTCISNHFKINNMKNVILTLFLTLFFIPAFSQNSRYEFGTRFYPSIKKEKLTQARYISEIMPQFVNFVSLPYKERRHLQELLSYVEATQAQASLSVFINVRENYERVIDYSSIEIITTSNGNTLTATSNSNVLTTAQKNNLNSADPGSDIRVKLKFYYKNWTKKDVNDESKLQEATYVAAVVPETEAAYPGGYSALTDYLVKNILQKASDSAIQKAIVKFTVNEQGRLTDAKLFQASADPKTDKLILDAIQKMPDWIPAKDSKGTNVKQEVSIPFGFQGC